MLIAIGDKHDKRKQGKAACYSNITGEIRAAGKKPQHIIYPYEEENGK